MKYNMSKDELAIVGFHYGVAKYHQAMTEQYIRGAVAKRLGIKPEDKINYDPTTGNIEVEKGIITPNKKQETKAKK